VGAHAAPRTAVVWRVLRDELARQGDGPLSVVDVGGGTGGFAVPLAADGHRVTVVDASVDALAALHRRAAEAGVAERVTPVQGDGDRLAELAGTGTTDLVLCHSLLEVVDDPVAVATAVAAVLRPGGAASVLVSGVVAAVLTRAVRGDLDGALALLDEPAAGGRRRFDTAGITALLESAGLAVVSVHGVRVVGDLAPADADPARLLAFELAVADRPPYRDLATQLHVLARRP
jgi:S-adenosylmethionine-dependent methyltransferase